MRSFSCQKTAFLRQKKHAKEKPSQTGKTVLFANQRQPAGFAKQTIFHVSRFSRVRVGGFEARKAEKAIRIFGTQKIAKKDAKIHSKNYVYELFSLYWRGLSAKWAFQAELWGAAQQRMVEGPKSSRGLADSLFTALERIKSPFQPNLQPAVGRAERMLLGSIGILFS